MTQPVRMYKILCFLKRREGMSSEEFRTYYEQHHKLYGERLLRAAGAVRYVRRYLTPLHHRADSESAGCGYDVVTEFWFDDANLFNQWRSNTRKDPQLMQEIRADELRLFDVTRMSFMLADECESSL